MYDDVIEFGSLPLHKDECRQAWGLQRMDELRADLRSTMRRDMREIFETGRPSPSP